MKKELFALDKKGNVKHWMIEVSGDHILVCHGRLGGKMQLKTTVAKPKNVGRANETSAEEQALLEAESKYKKQLDKCYRPTVAEAKQVGGVLPMLAHNYLDHGHRINFPCDVSRKLDGLRCLAVVDESTVTLFSRGGKTYPCPEQIKKELLFVSKQSGITKFDGELYIHGVKLQHIVSAAKKPNDLTKELVFHIFDLPSEEVWSTRKAKLELLQLGTTRSLAKVDNVYARSADEARLYLKAFIEEGYEGLMLRNFDGKYEYNHRSADLQKWKLMQDTEAYVLSVETDKNGEGVLTCHLPQKENKPFKCKMKGSHKERTTEMMELLIGKWIVVKYQQFTEDGIPQFPVGVAVRDCDEYGIPLE